MFPNKGKHRKEQEDDSDSESARQQYQRFNIHAEKRPIDKKHLDELYPPQYKNEYRSDQDMQNLLNQMMQELTDYHSNWVTRKFSRRHTNEYKPDEVPTSFVKKNLLRQG